MLWVQQHAGVAWQETNTCKLTLQKRPCLDPTCFIAMRRHSPAQRVGVLEHTYETTSCSLSSFQMYASWTAKEYRLHMPRHPTLL